MSGLISKATPDSLSRMDNNLQVIRDKIEEAELVNGQTRSQLLNMLDVGPGSTASLPATMSDILNLKDMKATRSSMQVNSKDILALKALVDRISFVLAGGPRKKTSTLLA